MAKVNAGNLLQHFVECQLATEMTRSHSALHLVATHAMAPFEAAEATRDGAGPSLLQAVLAGASLDSPVPLLRAYGVTGASPAHYPNSAELLAALLSEPALEGVLCEFDGRSTGALQERWAGRRLAVEGGSWRQALKRGALEAPRDVNRAWLFTLDPFTWLLARERSGARRGPNLCREDLENLRTVLGRYAQSSAPGAFCAFVYQLDAQHATDFRRSALALADRLGLERGFLGLPASGGGRHLAALLSPTPGLVATVAESWTRFREENLPG